ncbi:flippase [Spirosoma harenae]
MLNTETLKGYSRRKIFDLVKNIGWIFFDKIFRMAASLIIGVWIARYLGPSQFGVLNYVSIFPLVLTAFAGLGLTNILFNEFASETSSTVIKSLAITSFFIKLMAGLLSFILIVLVSVYIHTDLMMNILITISATSLIIQSLDIVDVYFQSQRIVQYSIIPKLIVFFIATGFRAFGLWHKADLLFFVVITSVELVASSLLSFGVYANYVKLKFSELTLDWSQAKHLVRLSWPLMLSELFLFLYVRVDLLMIKQLSTTTELGNYSVTIRITDIWYFIPVAITTGMMPSIINMRLVDYKEYLNRYTYLLNTLVALSITIAVGCTLTADWIINLLYGAQYQGVGAVFSLNIWIGVFVFLAIGSDRWFILESMQRFVLYRTIAGALVNIILNLILIPLYGALGASIATLVSQTFASYVINGFFSKSREIFRLQTNALLFLPIFLRKMALRAFS